jgi:hypothetical protein
VLCCAVLLSLLLLGPRFSLNNATKVSLLCAGMCVCERAIACGMACESECPLENPECNSPEQQPPPLFFLTQADGAQFRGVGAGVLQRLCLIARLRQHLCHVVTNRLACRDNAGLVAWHGRVCPKMMGCAWHPEGAHACHSRTPV